MPVDDVKEAIALTEKINANLPMTARPSKAYLKLMREQGNNIASTKKFIIDRAVYFGDEGGISCGIKPEEADEQVYVVSITHLEVDPNHPLAPEIQAYQRQRVRRIALQNSQGFASELLSQQQPTKKKRTKGFGQ